MRHGRRPRDPRFAWFTSDLKACIKHVRAREEQPHDRSPRGKAYTVVVVHPDHVHYCTLDNCFTRARLGPQASAVTAMGIRLGRGDSWTAFKFTADLKRFAVHQPGQPVRYGPKVSSRQF